MTPINIVQGDLGFNIIQELPLHRPNTFFGDCSQTGVSCHCCVWLSPNVPLLFLAFENHMIVSLLCIFCSTLFSQRHC